MAMAIDDDGPISFEIDSASAKNKDLIECQHQLRQELWPQLKHIPGYFARNLKGILHQKNFYRLNLIFWIVMGCGIARFGRRGLKTTET